MTRVLITGAAGFLGRRLRQALKEAGTIVDRWGEMREVTSYAFADRIPSPPSDSDPAADVDLIGDLADDAYVDRLAAWGPDSVFHLASCLTIEAERNPSAAFQINVEALRRLIGRVRNRPKLVFASSIAVFGGALPETVGDDHRQTPTTTYGMHKAINELLIADFSRHGRIDGRALRLPIVLTRPGAPQTSVSDKIAALVREPMNGVDVASPLAEDTPVPVVSAGAAVRGLLKIHDLPATELPPSRAFNLPALTITAGDMAKSVTARGARGGIHFHPDAQIQAIVAGWPLRFMSERAGRFGVVPDRNLDELIVDYLEHRNG